MKKKLYTIATLGSHTALQILKGAKDECFKTLLIATPDKAVFYKRFPFIDKIFIVPSFAKFPELEKKIKNENIILIPHGSFVAYLGILGNKKITIPYFGNKKVLDWETDREKQSEWMKKANLNPPKVFDSINNAKFPVIVKSFGAAGGKGYFTLGNLRDFHTKIKIMEKEKYIIQEYIVGVPLYIHYFYSPLSKQLEILGMDRRYETNVDGIGRLSQKFQEGILIDPEFVVVANSPFVLRESLLAEAYAMGERAVLMSKKIIDTRGLFGPFCLETIITPDQKFHVIEISCRIVAGTNLYIKGSPYTDLIYDVPMSTGRRIAREIKLAIQTNKLELITD